MVGDVQVAQGNLAAALTVVSGDLAIIDRLAKSDPGNAEWQRDLAVSYENRQRAGGAGQFAGRADLLSGRPRHQPTAWRSPIPAIPTGSATCRSSYDKVGNVQVAQGDLPAASRRIRRASPSWTAGEVRSRQWRLAARPVGSLQQGRRRADGAGQSAGCAASYQAGSPSGSAWRSPIPAIPTGSAICRCRTKVGDVQKAQGNLPAALTSYQASLAIADRLAKADPGNAGWQSDLSVSYSKVGNVAGGAGRSDGGVASYQAGLAIVDRLAKSDPGNAGWQRDLAVSLRESRRCANAAGQSAGRADLVSGRDWPSLTAWRSPIPAMPTGNDDLSISYEQSRQRADGAGQSDGRAEASYQAEPRHLDRLAKSDPGNADWQRDLSFSYSNIGDVQKAQGDLPAALTSYQAGLAICDRLAKSDPSNAGWQRDLSVSYEQGRRSADGAGRSAGRADLLSGGPRHRRPPGEVRSRQCRLAARSVGLVHATSATCRRRRAICRPH